MSSITEALKYIKNAGGNATVDVFIDDHEPIGKLLLDDFLHLGLAKVASDGRLVLSAKGLKEIEP